nr:unnamed protein product [Callosobruchus analis]
MASSLFGVLLLSDASARSGHATAKPKSIQIQMGNDPLKLKQDMPVRWNSRYEMFHSILKIREAVLSAIAIVNCSTSLEPQDFGIISHSLKILKPFKDIAEEAEELSDESETTISKVIVLVIILNRETIRPAWRPRLVVDPSTTCFFHNGKLFTVRTLQDHLDLLVKFWSENVKVLKDNKLTVKYNEISHNQNRYSNIVKSILECLKPQKKRLERSADPDAWMKWNNELSSEEDEEDKDESENNNLESSDHQT